MIAGDDADAEISEGATVDERDATDTSDASTLEARTSLDFSSLNDLLGTAWTVTSVDGEPYSHEGALSFYGEKGDLRPAPPCV